MTIDFIVLEHFPLVEYFCWIEFVLVPLEIDEIPTSAQQLSCGEHNPGILQMIRGGVVQGSLAHCPAFGVLECLGTAHGKHTEAQGEDCGKVLHVGAGESFGEFIGTEMISTWDRNLYPE